jgi:hypothetical protein
MWESRKIGLFSVIEALFQESAHFTPQDFRNLISASSQLFSEVMVDINLQSRRRFEGRKALGSTCKLEWARKNAQVLLAWIG